MDAAERWLTADELDRAARLVDADARAQHVIGRSVIRIVAAARQGCEPRECRVDLLDEGKPVVIGAGELQVSVAHTGRLVAVAATVGPQVGVDVEAPIDLGPRLHRLAARALAPSEARHLAQLPDADVPYAFARYWTVKEAMGKALGIRLMPAMSGIEVELRERSVRPVGVAVGPPPEQWTVDQCQLADGPELLAVAILAPAAGTIELDHLRPERLRGRDLAPRI